MQKINPVNFLYQNPSYERNARPVNFFKNPEVLGPMPKIDFSETFGTSNTAGLHGNYSKGAVMYTAASAGRAAGVSHNLGYA